MSGSVGSIIYGLIGATLFALLSSILQSCWSLPFIITRYFGWTLFTIADTDIITTISKKVEFSSIRNDLDEPSGIIFGSGYIGFIINDPKIIYCLCSYKQLAIFKEVKKDVAMIDSSIITLYVRYGDYFYLRYKEKKLPYKHRFTISIEQDTVMKLIKEIYLRSDNCVSLICGGSGTGKSTIGYLLAMELKASLCHTYCPTIPGDTLNKVYTRVEPTKEKPLIILVDEVDIIFDKIMNNLVIQHKNIPIEVYDKITWNRLLDDIDKGMYQNIILILTSNLTYEELCNKYDNSLVRKGRINSYHILTEKVNDDVN
jgi:hypothetical protein